MCVSSTIVSGLSILYHIWPLGAISVVPSGLKIDGCHEGLF